MNSLRNLLLGLALCTPALPAQTLFDDFLGTQIDQGRWWVRANAQHYQVANSRLSFKLPGGQEDAFSSNDAFEGDFDFILQFSNMQVTGPANQFSSLAITVFDATGQIGNLSTVEAYVGGDSTQTGFAYLAENKGQPHGSATVPATLKAGELRIRRYDVQNVKTVEVLVRPAGQRAWQPLRSWPDFLSNRVHIEIWAETDSSGSIAIDCEQITHAGTRVTAPRTYGQRCNDFGMRHFGVANVGNSSFALYQDGTQALASAPTLVFFGFSQLNLDLTAAGAPGCSLLCSPDLVLIGSVLDQEGEGVLPFPIPQDTRLVGIPLLFQSVAIAPVNALNLVFSEGVSGPITK